MSSIERGSTLRKYSVCSFHSCVSENEARHYQGHSFSLSLPISDNCKKCALVFDDVISSCEIINCQSTQVQVQYNTMRPLK